MDILKFRGLSISKEQFEEKYSLVLSDIEWKVVVSNAMASWENDIDQIRHLATKYVRDSMKEAGYSLSLEDGELKFKK
ncbi:hypothetical protein SAMN05661096_02909 [Marivirga sericea]|uniref:Uncharacterized protein n=1 Tax=Marivirga sericea TaxID=1028 RepID=A0A1X7KPH2_9BACT|nr:hypothetical protein [Marivirga sericea]SMG42627.1 hypothetical protein SAMN05661096_02909 [Marivirga sericea]